MSKVFGILGDTLSSKFHDWARLLPPAIAESGIEPFDAATRCPGGSSKGISVNNLGCFAYISASPLLPKIVTFNGGSIMITARFSISGKINVAGWKAALEATVSKTRFYVNAAMDQLDLKVLKIGGQLDKSNKVTGNPRFLIDFNAFRPLRSSTLKVPLKFQFCKVMVRQKFTSTLKGLNFRQR